MNPIHTLVVGFLASFVLAAPADAQQKQEPIQVPVEVAKRFDANQDGVLDAKERRALKAAMIKRRTEGEGRGQRGARRGGAKDQSEVQGRRRGAEGRGEVQGRRRGGEGRSEVQGSRRGSEGRADVQARRRGGAEGRADRTRQNVQGRSRNLTPEQKAKLKQRAKAQKADRGNRGSGECNCNAKGGNKGENGRRAAKADKGKGKVKAKKGKGKAKAKKGKKRGNESRGAKQKDPLI